MTTVFNTDLAPLRPEDPSRYLRYALGPLRPAPKEGQGWMFAAGELAMTAHDLALWDISMIDQTILKPASYRAMQTEVQLASGVGTRYGLGVNVSSSEGRRVISHGGEVSGFTANNTVLPDDRAAIVVLTNIDANPASGQIASRISNLLFAVTDAGPTTEIARRVFEGLQKGQIDRSLFTATANAYFTDGVANLLLKLGETTWKCDLVNYVCAKGEGWPESPGRRAGRRLRTRTSCS